MPTAIQAHSLTATSRVLLDLAEGALDDDELDTIVAWLSATIPGDVPESLIRLGVNVSNRVSAA